MDDEIVPRLPVNQDSIDFHDWKITFEKSHILKSICTVENGAGCQATDPACCELCTYRHALEMPHLPDMVFHKNKLLLSHSNGAEIYFVPIDALRVVPNGKSQVQVACAQEWKESRPESHLEEKVKPFDWTFTSNYQGTLNEKIRVEDSTEVLNKFKLMAREKILFYHDLTLYEDELHDNGISSCSVKIRVMPSGFFILLRHFLRVDNVMLKMHDTRFHFEIEKDYIFKEYTVREATYAQLEKVPPAFFTSPNEIENYMPIQEKKAYKLYFK